MAGMIYDARKIERALIPLRCHKVDVPPFTSPTVVTPHFVWETAWGHRFMVPDSCSDWILADIIEKDVKGTKPENWHEQ
jgi:hypothetical protein